MRKNDLSEGCFVLLLILGAITLVIQAIGVALKITIITALVIFGLFIAYKIIRAIYHLFNPEAKKAFIEKKATEDEKRKRRQRPEEAEDWAEIEREEEEAEVRRKKIAHQQHRDGDHQNSPYTYQIGNHGNESLAIRYGIANQERKVKEYWYHAKGGEKKRNQERDITYYEPAKQIRLQKIRILEKDLYEVKLTDYRDRKAKAVIEIGTEYVKTFYPIEESWFTKHADLETTLKGNGSFTLKELAAFHIQKAVGS